MCSWCLQLTGNIDAADDVGAGVSSVSDDSILVVVSSIDLEISDLSNDAMNYFIIDISVNAETLKQLTNWTFWWAHSKATVAIFLLH